VGVRYTAQKARTREKDSTVTTFPQCQKCKAGDLVPLSDFGSQGAAIHYKAWVCTNPTCGFNIKIRNGDVYMNEPIGIGGAHSGRMQRV
jgi:hypothetical protein